MWSSPACGLKQYSAPANTKKANLRTYEAETGTDETEAGNEEAEAATAEQQKIEPGDLELFKCVQVDYEALTCDFCPGRIYTGRASSRIRSWRRHMQEQHSDEPRIPCPEGCDKTFVPWPLDNVRRHVNKYHR